MLFHTFDYAVFLAIVLPVYWLVARAAAARIVWLVAASCVFYAAYRVPYLGLLLGAVTLDYLVSHRIARASAQRARRAWLAVSVASNLGLLAVFKYYDFFVGSAAAGLEALGVRVHPPLLELVLPVGISFFTFQTLSYTIDVYRGALPPARSWWLYVAFVSYFPQLVAGPIVRAPDLLPQLDRTPTLSRGDVARGAALIATGLVKKLAIADTLAINLVDRVFDQPLAYTSAEVIVALYAYTMQIYCDFSGYTDIARGSAMWMGISLPENFDRPYAAPNPAEFWRRWHMTLSSWLRDYLYFPLGGSRVGGVRAYANLWLTLFLIGLWHGAGATFVVYGAIHATAMVVHRLVLRRRQRAHAPARGGRLATVVAVVATLQLVVFSRVFFRASDFDNAWAVGARILAGVGGVGQVPGFLWAILIVTYAAHFSPKRWFESLVARFCGAPGWVQGLVLGAIVAALTYLSSENVVPYIYFQF